MTRHIEQLREAVLACEQAVQEHGWKKPITKSLFNTVTALAATAHDRRRRGTFDHVELPTLTARVQVLREKKTQTYSKTAAQTL